MSRAALQSQVELIQTKNDAVSQAEAALAQARDELAIAGEDVLQLAKKTHAYLCVYAQDDSVLQEELAKVKLSDSTRSGKAPRKKKPNTGAQKSSMKPELKAGKEEELNKKSEEKVSADVDEPLEQVALEGVLAAE